MDRLMRWLGLPGKAFVPMIVGFGCNVPGVIGTRTLDSHKERILTIMMLPFMSCGARLAIYVVFVAAFFKNNAYNVIFFLYLFGIVIAILTGMLMGKTILKGNNTGLIMELPRYELPAVKMLVRQAWFRLKNFLFKAGSIIVPLCILLSGLNYYKLENNQFNLLEATGKKLTPMFSPMGLQQDNWPATVGLLTGVMAKEVVIGTLSSLYNQKTNIIGVIGTKFADKAAALAYLVFVLLYTPCISVLAAIAKEVNKRWTIFCILWTTSVAYSSAIICYQAMTFMQHPTESSLWILGSIGIFGLLVGILKFSSRLTCNSYKEFPTAISLG
jgi:ferrous iron transport protein B